MSDTIPIEPANCPRCGAPISGEAPEGLCPKCLLAQAAMPTESGEASGSTGAQPSSEELRKAFPQLEILELIGRGGMGFVFKARQPNLERLVALKILPQSLASDPAFAERFAREGRLLARLNHPNIVTVYDFGQAGGLFYLLMEFVDGVNLRQAMRAGRFTPGQALSIVPKICEALQFAHDEGILHRDIKPENILLDNRGRIKIADFGIAKLLAPAGGGAGPGSAGAQGEKAPADQSYHLTETGKVFGTPHYMAPEQIENPARVDQRADIYSLGVVFYEMLTGELPLGRFAPPSAKSEVDARVDEIVLKALEREREHRQRSAGELKTQVETVAETPPQRLGAPAGKPAPPDRFWRGFAIATVSIVLALFLLPILYLGIGLLVPAWQKARSRRNTQSQTNAMPALSPNRQVQRLRLDFAEKQLKEASKRREVGNISELEYDQARLERDVAAAELKGDQIQIARLKLEFAEKQLGYAKKRYDAGVISAAEYNKAKLDRDIAAAEAGLADHPFKANEQASANPAADLREARARLGELRVSYGENHPEVQAQLARIAELERMSNEEPNAPADLREAKATLAELRVKYTDSHPAVQQQLARIRALESK